VSKPTACIACGHALHRRNCRKPVSQLMRLALGLDNDARCDCAYWDARWDAYLEETLHPTGRCSCWGEGWCDWCERSDAALKAREGRE
jgi:hypothetical protein